MDISKAYLDVHELPFRTVDAVHQRRGAGFKELASSWSGWSYESTGPWHRDFEEVLAGRLPLARVKLVPLIEAGEVVHRLGRGLEGHQRGRWPALPQGC